MVALDKGGGIAGNGNRFDDVRIKGSLGQKGSAADFLLSGFKDFNEGIADNGAFFLRFSDSFQSAEEDIRSVFVVEIDIKVFAEYVSNALSFISSKKAVVDKDAGELVPDGFVNEDCGYAGIDSAAESEDDMFFADLGSDLFNGHLAVGFHGPGGGATTDAVDKVGENLFSPGGMDYFGVELESKLFPLAVFDSGIV